jgi:hypothetical protein
MISPKLKHVRHPLRTVGAARRILSMNREIKRLGDKVYDRYRLDPRYDLASVSEGFAPRAATPPRDAELLERICAAYIRATERERSASEIYQPSGWWRQIRAATLGPVRKALAGRDLRSLSRMYENFFRDPCSTGLIGVPFGMRDAYFARKIKNLHRRYFLADALPAIDCWQARTHGRFQPHELAAPEIGNPFGVMINGTLVRCGTPFQRDSAHRLIDCLGLGPATVAEIGGGFGAMAYYLLRDRAATTYIDFDLPESLALTAYYLIKSLPHLRFLLFGEVEFSPSTLSAFDVVLMPFWEMESLADEIVDIAFSSHAISDILPTAMVAYLDTIARVVTGRFLYIGNPRGAESICTLPTSERPFFRLEQNNVLPWNAHRFSGGDAVECVFAPVPARCGATEERMA